MHDHRITDELITRVLTLLHVNETSSFYLQINNILNIIMILKSLLNAIITTNCGILIFLTIRSYDIKAHLAS